ncbi:hypothetical protein M885DRAFT_506148 [Pelagophyceae sp. CCMP2097]|nr:hypothetical protein M885DRAFT_506148 [Pelagophyceae sp. CCMP2097]
MAQDSKARVPSELVLSDKWDSLIERMVISAGLGLGFGLAASLVLARGSSLRMAMATFGMGIGVGSAYERSSADFKQR